MIPITIKLEKRTEGEQKAYAEGYAAGKRAAVKHGRWIMHIDDLFPAESTMDCDQCHEEQPLECNDKYCPNCGAQMSPSDEE